MQMINEDSVHVIVIETDQERRMLLGFIEGKMSEFSDIPIDDAAKLCRQLIFFLQQPASEEH